LPGQRSTTESQPKNNYRDFSHSFFSAHSAGIFSPIILCPGFFQNPLLVIVLIHNARGLVRARPFTDAFGNRHSPGPPSECIEKRLLSCVNSIIGFLLLKFMCEIIHYVEQRFSLLSHNAVPAGQSVWQAYRQ